MKLYYSAGSCSTSCHISLEESGLKYEAIGIDWDKTSDPNVAEVQRLNPLGTLPVMVLDQGKVLSQNVAIHSYIADQAPDKQLLPRPGTPERAEAMNWLGFVAADLHKGFAPLFGIEAMVNAPAAQTELKTYVVNNVQGYLGYLDQHLAGRDYLTGKTFTVADAYCFVVAGWAKWMNIPTSQHRNLEAYLGRVYQRPAVQKVMKEEGLLD